MSTHLTITGRVGADPEIRYTAGGDPVASLSVADTPRRYDRDTSQWVDAGPTLWQRIQVWGADGEQVAETVRKGDRVTVTGQLRADEWTAKDGTERKSTICKADSVARHAPRGTQGGPTPTNRAGGAQWGSQGSGTGVSGFGGGEESPF